ncbi:hypothetical protein FSP39_006100 [Pinctada imbricata]|uniref:Uncharacterized protein n=1 Tax=Pinctada imbricata TaxID=66713 RepID=A0AA88XF83_PINIB|nr:hypothetical protein FSP39_006100 [Pinctada imbricata]
MYVGSLVLCVIMTILVWLWKQTRRAADWPQGPPTIPFIGNANINFGDILTEFRKFRLQYGDIYSLVIGSKTVIVVNGLDTLKEMFIQHGDVVSQRADTIVTSNIAKYKGLLNSSGSLWKEHRSFVLSKLKEFGLGKRMMEEKILKEVAVLLQSISSTGGITIDISPLLRTSVSNVICSVVFGRRFEHDDERFNKIMNSISQATEHKTIYGILTLFPFLRFIHGDPLKYDQMMKQVEAIDSYIQEIIEEQKNCPEQKEKEVTNYLDAFLRCQQSEKANSTQTHSQKVIFDLFGAGSDPVSIALRWFILIILHKPEIQENMRAEILKEVGDSRYPSTADRSMLPYCDSVLHEVLRFGNITPLPLPHGLTENLYFHGYLIPKHALLFPNLDSVLNDPNVFENPTEFVPTRFLSKDGFLTGTEKLIAFGLGPRKCLGESLARMELFLFATSMIQQFKFLPPEGAALPTIYDFEFGLTRKPLEFNFRTVERVKSDVVH